VRTVQVRTVQVRTVQVRTVQVRTVQVRTAGPGIRLRAARYAARGGFPIPVSGGSLIAP
jgi:hypothetical protein